jgi:hypothetical protein
MADARSGGRPLPAQAVMWNPENYVRLAREDASDGQWLYCLKYTEPGDRQIVWTGKYGDGLVAVVDFSGAVRPRPGGRLYEGWGRVTDLLSPVAAEVVLRHRLIAPRFRHLQSVSGLDKKDAQAIADLVGRLPLAPGFDGHAEDWTEIGGTWAGRMLDPESLAEEIVAEESEISRELGFPSTPVRQKSLSRSDRADLWCPEGVVGEVKNLVTSKWGPGQIERYLRTCDERWPQHEWKGVLVQGADYLSPSAERRLASSDFSDRISLWTVFEDPDDPDTILYERLWPVSAR